MDKTDSNKMTNDRQYYVGILRIEIDLFYTIVKEGRRGRVVRANRYRLIVGRS